MRFCNDNSTGARPAEKELSASARNTFESLSPVPAETLSRVRPIRSAAATFKAPLLEFLECGRFPLAPEERWDSLLAAPATFESGLAEDFVIFCLCSS